MVSRLDTLLRSNTALNVTFGFDTVRTGETTATLMSRGRGDWVHGHGVTADDALDDLLRQIQPTNQPKLPGL